MPHSTLTSWLCTSTHARCARTHTALNPLTLFPLSPSYTSNQAHSSVIKAATIAGIPKANVRVLTTKAEDGYKLTPAALQEAMDADEEAGLVPTFCGATVGSTSAGYFDPISDIGLLCQKVHHATTNSSYHPTLSPNTLSVWCGQRNVWVHVDAAWAGSAAICPEHRHILNGVEHCDSMAFNPHKWCERCGYALVNHCCSLTASCFASAPHLGPACSTRLLTNFDCCAMWVKERAALLNALSITPAYLRSKEYDSGLVTDYRWVGAHFGRVHLCCHPHTRKCNPACVSQGLAGAPWQALSLSQAVVRAAHVWF